MKNELDLKKVCTTLNEIMEYELAGVVRYTHSALMVVGPHRIPIVSFLQEQANESLQPVSYTHLTLPTRLLV